MAVYRRGKTWWYTFFFANRRIQESAKTASKTVAKQAETQRRRELEQGFNSITDRRKDRIKTIGELAKVYLDDYAPRHERSATFAEYALGHVTDHLGDAMACDIDDQAVRGYQAARLREKAAPKSINEEVGFLLRLLGDQGAAIRAKLRRDKALKLAVTGVIGKAYTPEQKERLLFAAKAAKSPAIFPALVLALNAGMRDAEMRGLKWEQVDLERSILTVGRAKSEAGEGRTIPLNSALREALLDYAKWYTGRFGNLEPGWYVFPAGRPRPNDPTKPATSFKTAWANVRKRASVTGRWHDARHTLVTELCESGAGEQTIRDIAGHVSPSMMKHYAHIRMTAKREAVESILGAKAKAEKPEILERPATKSTTIGRVQ